MKELLFNNLELSINYFYNNAMKKFWKIIRHFVKNKDSSSLLPPILDLDNTDQNKFGFLYSEKAEILNKYFVAISTVDYGNTHLPNFEQKCQNLLSSIECSPDEIVSLNKLLNVNKATGPDIISNKMLKPVSKEISYHFRSYLTDHFVNVNLQIYGKERTCFLYSNKGTNLCPETIDRYLFLSEVGKIQEKLVLKHIYNHMNDSSV